MYRILEALLHHPAMHAPRPWLAATSSLQKVVVVAVVVAVESDKKNYTCVVIKYTVPLIVYSLGTYQKI